MMVWIIKTVRYNSPTHRHPSQTNKMRISRIQSAVVV